LPVVSRKFAAEELADARFAVLITRPTARRSRLGGPPLP